MLSPKGTYFLWDSVGTLLLLVLGRLRVLAIPFNFLISPIVHSIIFGLFWVPLSLFLIFQRNVFLLSLLSGLGDHCIRINGLWCLFCPFAIPTSSIIFDQLPIHIENDTSSLTWKLDAYKGLRLISFFRGFIVLLLLVPDPLVEEIPDVTLSYCLHWPRSSIYFFCC